jgi:hypothetical protein
MSTRELSNAALIEIGTLAGIAISGGAILGLLDGDNGIFGALMGAAIFGLSWLWIDSSQPNPTDKAQSNRSD